MTDYNVSFRAFKNRILLAAELAANVAAQLRGGIEQRGRASLLVSGGSTPVPFLGALSEEELDWQNVTVTLTDERWVDTANPDSNENLVKRHLLQNKAGSAKFVGLFTESPTARDGEQDCHKRIAAIARPFDFLVLGMGSDGHTASLVPGADNLLKAADLHGPKLCMAMSAEGTLYERMTLTLPALLDSKRIVLHITGVAKLKVLKQALSGEAPEEMPIRFVLSQAPRPVAVYWAP